MYYEDEKLKNVEPDEIYQDDRDLDDEESQEEEEETKKTTKKNGKVSIADPKDGIKFEPTLENIAILLSLCSIVMMIFAKMFAVIPLAICFSIFFWLGAIALAGGIVVYVIEILKAKKVKFEPQLVILILAAVMCGI